MSTCRQVEISFLGMPQIAHFQVEKWKCSLPWEGGHRSALHPPPARYATLPRAWSTSLPRKDCAPNMFWLITPRGGGVHILALSALIPANHQDNLAEQCVGVEEGGGGALVHSSPLLCAPEILSSSIPSTRG